MGRIKLTESLITNITNSLINTTPAEVIAFIISTLPILELRGGLISASLLKINWFYAFFICVLGNLLPLPFILLFINKIFVLLKKTCLKNVVIYFEKKAENKSISIKKHQKLGLFLFVAVPLPGTGGWTATLVAAVMGMKLKDAILPIFYGVITSGLIMSVISYVIPTLFK